MFIIRHDMFNETKYQQLFDVIQLYFVENYSKGKHEDMLE